MWKECNEAVGPYETEPGVRCVCEKSAVVEGKVDFYYYYFVSYRGRMIPVMNVCGFHHVINKLWINHGPCHKPRSLL